MTDQHRTLFITGILLVLALFLLPAILTPPSHATTAGRPTPTLAAAAPSPTTSSPRPSPTPALRTVRIATAVVLRSPRPPHRWSPPARTNRPLPIHRLPHSGGAGAGPAGRLPAGIGPCNGCEEHTL